MRGRLFAIHLLALSLPVTLVAQVRSVGVGCDRGHHWRSPCNGESDCDAVLARHNCSAHGECRSSDGSPASIGRFSLDDTPSRVVVKSAIGGGFLGALAGSFKLNADSGAMAGAGAAIGAGVFMAMGVVKNRGDWSRTSATVVGAVAGAAIGAGTGLLADGKFKKGSAEDLATPDKAGSQAAVGAVIGASVGFTLNALATSQLRFAPRFRRIVNRVRFIESGRRFGIAVLW